jgi:hypothetical protein
MSQGEDTASLEAERFRPTLRALGNLGFRFSMLNFIFLLPNWNWTYIIIGGVTAVILFLKEKPLNNFRYQRFAVELL